jgi:PAS domain S-box-containing protein
VPFTWSAESPPPRQGRGGRAAWTAEDARSYLIAFGGVVAALTVSRLTWPYFARTPFILLFGAAFAASRWSSETASVLSIFLGALGAGLMAPPGSPPPFETQSLVTFVAGSLVINRFVVGRNRTEAALRESEGQFRAAWDNAAFGAALLTPTGLIARINPAMERTLGYPSAAWAGVPFSYFCPAADTTEERARFTAMMQGAEEWSQREQLFRRADGASIWCRVTISAVSAGAPRGGTTGALMVLEDVTERREAEGALRASEDHYRRIFHASPEAMWVTEPETGRFLAVNRTAVARYGYTDTEFLALSLHDIFLQEDWADVDRHADYGAGGRTAWRHRKKDGALIDVEIESNAVPWGGRAARLTLITDVTERRVLEERVRHSQKMDAVAQLAGGIAHDFNNLLTTIQGYSELLLAQMGPDKPMTADLHEIHTAAVRAAALTRQLLAFGRRQHLHVTVIDVNAIVGRIGQVMRRIIAEDIEVELVPGVGHLHVKADVSQFEQMLMNLVVNARDAVRAPEGRISIRTRREEFVSGTPARPAFVRPGSYVVIEVEDNGCGMDTATQARAFEPFFTTKESEKGTGLGLALVYGIVQQCGGQIDVDSEPDRGSIFRVYLPWTNEPLRTDAHPFGSVALVGNETVLVVEDDARARAFVTQVLRRYGYQVREAAGAEEAMGIAGAPDVPIDLVLTDVVMPRMSGPELGVRLQSRRTEPLPVLYMSGYSVDALTQRGMHADTAMLLHKPFSPTELLARVRHALDGSRP